MLGALHMPTSSRTLKSGYQRFWVVPLPPRADSRRHSPSVLFVFLLPCPFPSPSPCGPSSYSSCGQRPPQPHSPPSFSSPFSARKDAPAHCLTSCCLLCCHCVCSHWLRCHSPCSATSSVVQSTCLQVHRWMDLSSVLVCCAEALFGGVVVVGAMDV